MKSPASRRAGFTIIEILTSLALMGMVMGSVFGVLGASQQSLVEGSAQSELEVTARRVLGRVCEDFRPGMLYTVLMDSITLSPSAWMYQAGGYQSGKVIQGALVGYTTAADSRDPANGKDDDGDGYVDEKVVLRMSGATVTEVAGNVKDLRFSLEGLDRIRCTISLERTVRGRITFSFTDSAVARIRN